MGKAKKRTPAQLAADKLRTGRPPKPPAEKHGEQIMVYLTKAERAWFEALAKQEGVPIAVLIMRPWREKGEQGMAGVRKKPNPGGKYHGWFIDAAGKRKFFTGTRSKADTLRITERLEDEHRQIRLGYRSAPTSADRYRLRLFKEVATEFLSWGSVQGGRGGRGWAPVHAHNRRVQLEW